MIQRGWQEVAIPAHIRVGAPMLLPASATQDRMAGGGGAQSAVVGSVRSRTSRGVELLPAPPIGVTVRVMLHNQERPTFRGEQSSHLTPREVEVLRLIASGKSSKQAAYELGMSFRTALCHRYRIFRKLGVTKAAELVRCAAQMGVIELHASPQSALPLPPRLLAMQQENTAECQKL